MENENSSKEKNVDSIDSEFKLPPLPSSSFSFNDDASSDHRSLNSAGTESSFKLPENVSKNSRKKEQKKGTRKQKNRLPFKSNQNKGYDFQIASHTQTENYPFEWKFNFEISSNVEKSSDSRMTSHPVLNIFGEGASENSPLPPPTSSLSNANCSRNNGSLNESFKLPENSTRDGLRELKKSSRKLTNQSTPKTNLNIGIDLLAAYYAQTKNTPFGWKSNSSQISGRTITDEITSDNKDSLTQISSPLVSSDLTNSGNEANSATKPNPEFIDENYLVNKVRSLHIFNAVSSNEPAIDNKTSLPRITFLVSNAGMSLDPTVQSKTETFSKSALTDNLSKENGSKFISPRTVFQFEEKRRKEIIKSHLGVSKIVESDYSILPNNSLKNVVEKKDEPLQFFIPPIIDKTTSENIPSIQKHDINRFRNLDEDTLRRLGIFSSDCFGWLPKLPERTKPATKTNNERSKSHPEASPKYNPSDKSKPLISQMSPSTKSNRISEYIAREPNPTNQTSLNRFNIPHFHEGTILPDQNSCNLRSQSRVNQVNPSLGGDPGIGFDQPMCFEWADGFYLFPFYSCLDDSENSEEQHASDDENAREGNINLSQKDISEIHIPDEDRKQSQSEYSETDNCETDTNQTQAESSKTDNRQTIRKQTQLESSKTDNSQIIRKRPQPECGKTDNYKTNVNRPLPESSKKENKQNDQKSTTASIQ